MKNQKNATLTYTKVGNYFLPDLIMDDQPDEDIGIYGRMRERYLQEHHPGTYTSMLLTGRLTPHLLEINNEAQVYLDTMIARMATAAGVTEDLKAKDQMAWVGRMNTIRAQVEEIIRTDLIYR